jgi:hypothetical protein
MMMTTEGVGVALRSYVSSPTPRVTSTRMYASMPSRLVAAVVSAICAAS